MQSRMIYGYYPDVVNNPGDEPVILRELSGSYLYKDILTMERIQKPDRLERLVQALALQLGSDVSFNELKKSRKVYFYDNGIRNSVINQYSPLELRSDTGQLWENFLISGRLKFILNSGRHMNTYFWRSTAQQEIDYIEESEGKLKAFEMKWNPLKSKLISRSFSKGYPDADLRVITPENYEQFLTKL